MDRHGQSMSSAPRLGAGATASAPVTWSTASGSSRACHNRLAQGQTRLEAGAMPHAPLGPRVPGVSRPNVGPVRTEAVLSAEGSVAKERLVPARWAWPSSGLVGGTPQKAAASSRDKGAYDTPPKDYAPRSNVLQEIPTPQRKVQPNVKAAVAVIPAGREHARTSTDTTQSSQPRTASSVVATVEPKQVTAEPSPPFLRDFSVLSGFLGAEAATFSFEEMPSSMRRALHFLRLLQNDVPCTPLIPGRGYLPAEQRSTCSSRPTLVLDLDETLIHCSRSARSEARCGKTPPQMYVRFEDSPRDGAVRWRPFAQLFLSVVARRFEVVVFTASDQAYADQVIDELDPAGLIQHRLYRQHCTQHVRGAFFKELQLVGRPMTRTILVDNSPISIACNPDNGILIKSWYGDAFDRELIDLLPILDDAITYADVSMYLSSRYGLREFYSALGDRPT